MMNYEHFPATQEKTGKTSIHVIYDTPFLDREIQQLEQLVERETVRLVSVPDERDSQTETEPEVTHEFRPLQHPCAKASDRRRQRALWEVAGVDLTAITGVGLETALLIVSELGADVSAFPTEKHFCSWLALAPNNQISGGNVLRKHRPRKANRLGQAFRQCAIAVRRSETWLGAKHRRRLARMEKARAIKATAHEIARLVYAMLRDGTEYVERSIEDFEKAYQDRKIAHVRRQAHALGCVLIPMPS